MNIFNDVSKILANSVQCMTGQTVQELGVEHFTVNLPPEKIHADLSTNLPFLLAPKLKQSPQKIAENLQLSDDLIVAKDVQGGFLNLFLSDKALKDLISFIILNPDTYGSLNFGQSQRVNIEYVSANPTGPMHVGHARGAVLGNVLANLFRKCGFETDEEYYINDSGNQIQYLGESLYARYQSLFSGQWICPEKGYPGEYLIPLAEELRDLYGDTLPDHTPEFLQNFAVNRLMKVIREDLALLNIHHDIFISEKSILEENDFSQTLSMLDNKGLLYQGVLDDPADHEKSNHEDVQLKIFKSTELGDDKDRAMTKPDGSLTYFASDCLYHQYKAKRGYSILVNIWGIDHGGYVKRIQAFMKSLNLPEPEIHLCQLVKLTKNQEELKMSKRAGQFVTLRDLCTEVGSDAIRFFMLMRQHSSPLNFDLEAVQEASKNNPVFYVQYAHARCCSVLRHAQDSLNIVPNAEQSDSPLSLEERKILLHIASLPVVIEVALTLREPHKIPFYLYDLASLFHTLWSRGKKETHLRFIIPHDKHTTQDKINLVASIKHTLGIGLQILGIHPCEELRYDDHDE